MKKIYFPNAWGETNVKNMFIHQTPKNSGDWDDIKSVNKKEDADFIIVQDGTNENVDYSR